MRRQSRAGHQTGTSESSYPSNGRRYHLIVACGVAIALSGLLKLPALLTPPGEADEQIYWQLAEKLSRSGEYNLRGSPLLSSLSPQIYDRPIFHHPPLFAAMLVPFVRAGSPSAAVLVSWFGHALTVLAVALIGRELLRQRDRPLDFLAPAFTLPLIGVAADPLLAFVSKRLWIDSLLSGLVAISVAAVVLATGDHRRMRLTLAGIFLGLAGLAKLTGLLIVPLLLVVALRGDHGWRERLRSAAALLLPIAALVIPWLVVFYNHTGVFVPGWVKPDESLMALYPFLRTAVERPWHYYLTTLLVISPALVCLAWTAAAHRAIWRDPTFQLAAGWFVLMLVTQTGLALTGYGFQMRHVAPGVAAMYVGLQCLFLERPRPLLQFLVVAAIVVGAATAAMHLFLPELDEMLTFGAVAGLVKF